MEPGELIGTWRFVRSIRDRRSGTDYAATGDAEFTSLSDGRIRWIEHGMLEWSGGSTVVERTLYLVPDAEGAGWAVTFDDGRDFHPWAAGRVEHPCGRDLYRGEIAPESQLARRWSITWDVAGPEKDYTMTSSYAQAAAGRIV